MISLWRRNSLKSRMPHDGGCGCVTWDLGSDGEDVNIHDDEARLGFIPASHRCEWTGRSFVRSFV